LGQIGPTAKKNVPNIVKAMMILMSS
jgi:hypothetical protein